MADAVSALAIRAVVGELQQFVGQHLSNIQQTGEASFKFSFGSRDVIVELGRRIYVASFENPGTPSALCMLIRKHIRNARLSAVRQHDFDRIVVLEFPENAVFFELFSRGNLVITDSGGIILSAFREGEWKDRKIRRGEKYVFPPSKGRDPTLLSEEEFKSVFTEQDVVHSLVNSAKLPGKWAEEICRLAGVDKAKKAPDEEETGRLYASLQTVLGYSLEIIPVEFPGEAFKTVSAAVEAFEAAPKKKDEKLLLRKAKQVEMLAEYERHAQEARAKGDLIYSNYALVEQILASARTAKKEEIEKLNARLEKGKVIVELRD